MKINLMNIELKSLSDKVIIRIAKDLGCDYIAPKKLECDLMYRYLVENIDYRIKNNYRGDILEKEIKLYEQMTKEYDNKYSEYINKIYNWLIDHNYMEEVDRFPQEDI